MKPWCSTAPMPAERQSTPASNSSTAPGCGMMTRMVNSSRGCRVLAPMPQAAHFGIGLEQDVQRAVRFNLSLVEHDDRVRVLEHRPAMRYHQARHTSTVGLGGP